MSSGHYTATHPCCHIDALLRSASAAQLTTSPGVSSHPRHQGLRITLQRTLPSSWYTRTHCLKRSPTLLKFAPSLPDCAQLYGRCVARKAVPSTQARLVMTSVPTERNLHAKKKLIWLTSSAQVSQRSVRLCLCATVSSDWRVRARDAWGGHMCL